jgi:hypothetical protein
MRYEPRIPNTCSGVPNKGVEPIAVEPGTIAQVPL